MHSRLAALVAARNDESVIMTIIEWLYVLAFGLVLYAAGFVIASCKRNTWPPYKVEFVFMSLTNAGIAVIMISSVWLILAAL